MTTDTISAMNEFKITARPIVVGAYKGKYEKLYVALKNLANDRAIELPASYLEGKDFKSWRNSMRTATKKQGIEARIVQQNGAIYIFKR